MPKKGSSKDTGQKINEPVVTLLAENVADLQNSFAVLTGKLDNLANEISSLLRLFEISARSIAEKPELGFEKEFISKLNALLEQNKVIAKAMAIIEERTRTAPMPAPQPAPMQYPQQQRPMPAMPQRMTPPPAQPAGMIPVPEEYTQSSFAPERKPRPLPQV